MNKKTFKQWFALMVLLLMGTTASQAQSLTIDNFTIKQGETKAVTMKMDKGDLAAARSIQVDITFSEGLSLAEKPTIVQGAMEGASISTNVVASGATRLACLSFDGNSFVADATEVITLKVTAADNFEQGTITLSNIEIGASGGTAKYPQNSTCTVTKEADEPGPTGVYYQKVTATSDIVDGEYLIVYETGNVAFNGALTTLDVTSNTVAVVIADGKIASSEAIDAATFTIDLTAGTLKSASGNYIGVSTNSNGLKQDANAATYTHTFAIDDNGNAIIAAVFDGSTMSLRYNKASNQARFRYYKNAGQEVIALYKKISGGDTPPTPPVETIAAPAFSIEAGTYQEAQTVELSCTTEGAAIYYTLDGTDPTAESTLYEAAITITETTTLKAIAIKGELSSEIAEATYVIEVAGANIIFDFNASDHATSSDGSTAGDIPEAGETIVEGDATMTITANPTGTVNRFWSTNNGPQLRMYGGRMIIEAAEGKAIVKVEITNGKWNAGNTFNGETATTGTWEGNSTNVVLKVAGNTQMNKVVVTLADKNDATTTYDDPDAEDPEVTAARTALTAEIATATSMLSSETATDEQKEALQAAIDAAQAVADNADATKEELEAALGALKTAEEAYLTPTGISAIEAAAKNGELYNLSGQRVNRVQKGVFIVGGKKIMK